MTFTVTAGPAVGYAEKSQTAKSESQATKIAQAWAATGQHETVHIEFFRKSDGQQGFINPDGAGVSGKNWVR